MAGRGDHGLTVNGALLAASAVALAIERLAYIWISRSPDAFRQVIARLPGLAGHRPPEVVRRLFVAFKLVQATVFIGWFQAHGSAGMWSDVSSHPGTLAAAAVLIGAGQYLNLRVFQLLGREAVFYGRQFGEIVPRCRAFPFSVVAHPQYLGTCLSIWGLFLLVRFPHPDWVALPLIESAYYAAGALLER